MLINAYLFSLCSSGNNVQDSQMILDSLLGRHAHQETGPEKSLICSDFLVT